MTEGRTHSRPGGGARHELAVTWVCPPKSSRQARVRPDERRVPPLDNERRQLRFGSGHTEPSSPRGAASLPARLRMQRLARRRIRRRGSHSWYAHRGHIDGGGYVRNGHTRADEFQAAFSDDRDAAWAGLSSSAFIGPASDNGPTRAPVRRGRASGDRDGDHHDLVRDRVPAGAGLERQPLRGGQERPAPVVPANAPDDGDSVAHPGARHEVNLDDVADAQRAWTSLSERPTTWPSSGSWHFCSGGHDRAAPAVGLGAGACGPLRDHRRAPPGVRGRAPRIGSGRWHRRCRGGGRRRGRWDRSVSTVLRTPQVVAAPRPTLLSASRSPWGRSGSPSSPRPCA